MWARRRILEQNFASHKVEMSVFREFLRAVYKETRLSL